MKALSIKQPFAELILQGRKKIELRTWNTKFRGRFLIHASKIPDKKAMEEFGFKNLLCGGIVGKVILKEIKYYKSEEEHKADCDKHLASSFWGNYGFVLENPEKINFIPCRGNLNFWDFNIKT